MEATDTTLERVTAAYITCALWSSTADDGEPLDGLYFPSDLADETQASMSADCADFLQLLEREGVDIYQMDFPLDLEQIGSDFWLTRNRHGAGFWDRGLGELGETLTSWAHSYGTSDLYVGDDGLLYVA